jgi:hypothetical protein
MPIKVKNALFDTCFNTSRKVSDIIVVSAKHRSNVDLYAKLTIVILAPSGIDICSVTRLIVSDDNEEFCSGSKKIST